MLTSTQFASASGLSGQKTATHQQGGITMTTFSEIVLGAKFKYCGLICVKASEDSYQTYASGVTSSSVWGIKPTAMVSPR